MARSGRPLPTIEVAARPGWRFREQNRGYLLPGGGKSRFREQKGGLVLPAGDEEEFAGRGRLVGRGYSLPEKVVSL